MGSPQGHLPSQASPEVPQQTQSALFATQAERIGNERQRPVRIGLAIQYLFQGLNDLIRIE